MFTEKNQLSSKRKSRWPWYLSGWGVRALLKGCSASSIVIVFPYMSLLFDSTVRSSRCLFVELFLWGVIGDWKGWSCRWWVLLSVVWFSLGGRGRRELLFSTQCKVVPFLRENNLISYENYGSYILYTSWLLPPLVIPPSLSETSPKPLYHRDKWSSEFD
jgi:hypothetical protein